MATIQTGGRTSDSLAPGLIFVVDVPAGAVALVTRRLSEGGAIAEQVTLAGEGRRFGPFSDVGLFEVSCDVGTVSWSKDWPAFPDAAADMVAASTYTLTAADKGRIKDFTTACAVTLPAALPVGFSAMLCQVSAGAVTVAAESGATLRQVDGLFSLRGQWAEVSARVRRNIGGAAAEWVLSGALA